MELFKAYQISSDYKDPRSTPNWEMRQFAEILFIDKSHAHISPTIYQLKECYLPLENTLDFCRTHAHQFSRDGFLVIGHQVKIDRKKKEILLDNNNVVSYNHLVIVSGSKPLISFENEELLNALQALNDALRVKPKIPSSFANTTYVPSPYAPSQSQEFHLSIPEPGSEDNIDKMFNLSLSIPQGITFELNALNKRLYEVQL